MNDNADQPSSKIAAFRPRSGSQMDDDEAQDAAEREAIMDTLGNVLALQAAYDGQMAMAIGLIGELQSRVSDLEHEVAALKKAMPKKPAILNAQGARAN